MFAIAALAVAASVSVVDSIRIESRWGGLGTPSHTVYTIRRHGDSYRRRFTAVPAAAVERLAAAVAAAPVKREAALRSLATPEWLNERATEPHDGLFVPVCSPEAKRLLAQHLVDPKQALEALDQYLKTTWTDDSPHVSVRISFHDGRTTLLESSEQPALMLPWKIGSIETWNPEVPRAIVALLPDGAEPRLTDGRLAKAYVEEVASELRDPLDNLEERCVHRRFLAAVEKAFEVVRTYHGASGWFTAYVRRPDFPPNLVLTLVIRDDDKPDALAKLERTVQRTKGYVDIVHGYIGAHPEKHFTIWCEDGESVKGDVHSVRFDEYDPGSGIVSHPRIISADGRVRDDPGY